MKVLKKEMKQKRMSHALLALRLNVSKQTVSNWLSGKCAPDFDNMDALKELGFSETAYLEPDKEV